MPRTNATPPILPIRSTCGRWRALSFSASSFRHTVSLESSVAGMPFPLAMTSTSVTSPMMVKSVFQSTPRRTGPPPAQSQIREPGYAMINRAVFTVQLTVCRHSAEVPPSGQSPERFPPISVAPCNNDRGRTRAIALSCSRRSLDHVSLNKFVGPLRRIVSLPRARGSNTPPAH